MNAGQLSLIKQAKSLLCDAPLCRGPEGPTGEQGMPGPPGVGGEILTDNFIVAGGDALSTMIYSYDGKTYYRSESGSTKFLQVNAVAWNGTLWLAVGKDLSANSLVCSSSDGISWNTIFDDNYLGTINTVVWGNDRWLIGGMGEGCILYSFDANIWYYAKTEVINGAVLDIKWNGKMFIAAGGYDLSNNTVAYSYDGDTWKIAVSDNSLFTIARSICWDGRLWYIVGSAGLSPTIGISMNGINWEIGIAGDFDYGPDAYLSKIAWNGRQLIIGQNNSILKPIAYSNSGFGEWTFPAVPPQMFCIKDITWNGSYWVIVGDGTSKISYSYNAESWLNSTGSSYFEIGLTATSRNILPYLPEKVPEKTELITENFMIVGGIYNVIYSYDGKIWYKSYSASNLLPYMYGICWNGTIWVAVGSEAIIYSSDGINWFLSEYSGFDGDIYCIVWNGSMFVAGGYSSGPNDGLSYSYDGVVWNSSIGSSFSAVNDIAWNGSMFIAVGVGAWTNAYSYDGIVWINDNNNLFLEGRGIAWNGTIWSAVGYPAVSYYSSDGITWNESDNPFTDNIFDIAWNGSMWVMVGENTHVIAYSYNGITYTAVTNIPYIYGTIRAVAWNGSLWVATGSYNSYNTVLYSTDGIIWYGDVDGSSQLNQGYCIASRRTLPYVSLSYTSQINLTSTINGLGTFGYVSSSKLTYELSSTITGLGTFGYISSINLETILSNFASTISDIVSSFTSVSSITLITDNFIVGGGAGPYPLAYTYNGLDWLPSVSGSGLFSECHDIAWSGTMWVAGGFINFGSNYAQLAYSSDGINWSPSSNVGDFTSNITCISWNGSYWLAGGDIDDSAGIAKSLDGINWYSIDSTPFSYEVNDIAWNGKMHIAVAGGGFGPYATMAYSYDGDVWYTNDNYNSLATTSISWNGTMWLTTGWFFGPGMIQYSYDGMRWDWTENNNFSNFVARTAWNGSIWVAVGDAGAFIQYSGDGINWSNTVGPSLDDLADFQSYNSVTWNGNLWTVAGSSNFDMTMLYSYDGINWSNGPNSNFFYQGMTVASRAILPNIPINYLTLTNVQSNITNLENNQAITDTFTLVGGDGPYPLIYSYNGTSWAPVSNMNQMYNIVQSICWNGTVWVIGGQDSGYNALFMQSSDGLNWTLAENYVFDRYINEIRWNKNNNLFIAVGDSSNGGIGLSRDGSVWVPASITNIDNCTYSLASDSVKTIIVGYGSDVNGKYSYDGNIWNTPTYNSSNLENLLQVGYGIKWNSDYWVAVGQDSNYIGVSAYSKDGFNWYTTSNGFSNSNCSIQAVEWNGSLWVIAGTSEYNSPIIQTSPDGSNWYNVYDIPPTDGGIFKVKWNGARWIATGSYNFTNTVIYSDNGYIWQTINNNNLLNNGSNICSRYLPPIPEPNIIQLQTENFSVAVGEQPNTIIYSYDGRSWYSANTANDIFSTCYGIAYNGSYWLAVGTSGGDASVAISSDGINWSFASDASFCGNIYGIAWNGSMWIAVGDDCNNCISYSYNGYDWISNVTIGGSINNLYGVAWGDNKWVAVGEGSNPVQYSFDGIVWASSISGTNLIGSNRANDIAWNGNMWMMVGQDVSGYSLTAYSYDGITWHKRYNTINEVVSSVAWNGSMWVVVGHTGESPTINYSTDGLTWNTPSYIQTYSAMKSVGWNGSIWIAISDYFILYSVDGYNWSFLESNINQITAKYKIASRKLLTQTVKEDSQQLVLTDNFMVAGSVGSDSVLYSYNGLIWHYSPSGISLFTTLNAVVWNGTIWVGVGEYANSSQIAYSSDGISWTPVNSLPFCCYVSDVAWNGKIWVAVGDNDYMGISTSSDGINWNIPTTTNINDDTNTVAWNGTIWLAGGSSTYKAVYSYDGDIWNPSTSDVSGGDISSIFTRITSIKWNNTMWIAVGAQYSSPALAYSYDGFLWHSINITSLFESEINGIAWNGSKWTAVGDGYYVAYSTDGINWSSSNVDINYPIFTLFKVTWNGSLWNATGVSDGYMSIFYSYDGLKWFVNKSVNTTDEPGISFALGARYQQPLTTGSTQPITTTTITENFSVAVGSGSNKITYTYDGLKWYPATSANSLFTECYSIVFNGIVWLAVGTNGGDSTICISSDGINWKFASSGEFNGYIYDVAWNGSIWVAVGDYYGISYSYDGYNWFQQTSFNPNDNIYRAVAWGDNKWVAVGNYEDNTVAPARYSLDGIVWNLLPSAITIIGNGNGYATGIAYNGNMWIMTMSYNTQNIGGYYQRIATSYDGINWTGRDSKGFDTYCTSVAWNGSRWVVGGDYDNYTHLITSTDGVEWDTVSSDYSYGYPDTNIDSVIWNGSLWIASSSSTLFTSTDAYIWTVVTGDLPSISSIHKIASRHPLPYIGTPQVSQDSQIQVQTENFMIAGGEEYNSVLYSYNGLTWNISTSGASYFMYLFNVAWNGSMWVGVGINSSDNAMICFSSDGINWIPANTYYFSELVYDVVWNGTLWVAVGDLFDPYTGINYSYDGNIWYLANSYSLDVVHCVAWNGTMFIAGGEGDNSCQYSYDGINWYILSAMTSYFTGCWNIEWNGNMWVAVGTYEGASRYVYSYDGFNWTSSTYLYSNNIYGVAWNGSMWIILGDYNHMKYSFDGISWTDISGAFSNTMHNIAWNGSVWVVVGSSNNDATIMYSRDGFNWYVNRSAINDTNPNIGYAIGARKYIEYKTIDKTITEAFSVAVGSGENPIIYTYDGNTWYSAHNVPFLTCYAVVYNGSYWLAVGDGEGSSIAKSSNGINWQYVSSGSFSSNIYGIAWNGSMWVAVGDNDWYCVSYSYDGVKWYPDGSHPSTSGFTVKAEGIAWGDNKWVAVGTNDASGGNPNVQYSTDGILWKVSESGSEILTTSANAVAWNGTMWLASGLDVSNNPILIYSYDGIQWSSVGTFNYLVKITGIAWNGTFWAIIGDANLDTPIYISKNGLYWNEVDSLEYIADAKAITWNGSMWIVDMSGTMLSSTDSYNWYKIKGSVPLYTQRYSIASRKLSTFVSLNSQIPTLTENFIIAGGDAYNPILYSYNGLTWQTSTSGSSLFNMITGVAWNGRLWVATGLSINNYALVAQSSDGINWFILTEPPFAYIINGVIWNGSLWIIVGDTDYSGIAYSSDGINWNVSDTPLSGEAKCIAYNGVLHLVGSSGAWNKCIFSYNGIDWYNNDNMTSYFTICFGIAWGDTKWVAVGNFEGAARVISSTDGFRWDTGSHGFSSDIFGVAWNGTVWVIVGDNVKVQWSMDGSNFTSTYIVIPTLNSNLYAIAWNGTMWIATGNNNHENTILYSYDAKDWFINRTVLHDTVIGVGRGLGTRKLINYKPKSKEITEAFTVAVGSDNTILYSYDGLIWQKTESANNFSTCYSVAYNGLYWLAVGAGDGATVTKSSDGIYWEYVSNGEFWENIYDIDWNGSMWVAVGDDNNGNNYCISYSYDGNNWFSTSTGFIPNGLVSLKGYGVAWGNDKWVAVGQGTYEVVYSYDGIVWESSESGSSYLTKGSRVAWNGSMWLIVGSDISGYPVVLYSYNGIFWETNSGSLGHTSAFNDIAWNGSMWVLVGDATVQPIHYSSDGLSWNQSYSYDIYTSVQSVGWNGKYWIASVSGDFLYATSDDMSYWRKLPSAYTPLSSFRNKFASRRVLAIPGTVITQSYITSTIYGLGTLGYVSTTQLQSTVEGLGLSGYISSSQLQSSITSINNIIGSSTISHGKLLYVDSVYGNDILGGQRPYTVPFSTISVAMYYTSPGDCIYLYPGAYNETVIFKPNISMKGVAMTRVSIYQSNVGTDTTLITMASNTSLEDLTLNLTSTTPTASTLVGVQLSSIQATVHIHGITVNISNASLTSNTVATNIYGIYITGHSPEDYIAYDAIEHTAITVVGAGSGKKRCIYSDDSNALSLRNVTLLCKDVAGATYTGGSYYGIETAKDQYAYVSIKESSVSGISYSGGNVSSDISQTTGKIIVSHVDLINRTANSGPLTINSIQDTYTFAVSGILSNVPGQGGSVWTGKTFLIPGTLSFTGGNGVPITSYYGLYKPLNRILNTMSFQCATGGGSNGGSNISSFAVLYKNGSALSNWVIPLNDGTLASYISTQSLTINASDTFGVYLSTSQSNTSMTYPIVSITTY